jgi:hypothetical protein
LSDSTRNAAFTAPSRISSRPAISLFAVPWKMKRRISFSLPVSSAFGVEDTFLLTVTNGTTGTIQFSGFNQTYSIVPEPATAASLAAGLLVLGLGWRRRRG